MAERKQEAPERWDPNWAITPERLLQHIQAKHMPAQKLDIVAINLENGEYIIAADANQALKGFRERWPEDGFYLCRVDGGPAMKL